MPAIGAGITDLLASFLPAAADVGTDVAAAAAPDIAAAAGSTLLPEIDVTAGLGAGAADAGLASAVTGAGAAGAAGLGDVLGAGALAGAIPGLFGGGNAIGSILSRLNPITPAEAAPAASGAAPVAPSTTAAPALPAGGTATGGGALGGAGGTPASAAGPVGASPFGSDFGALGFANPSGSIEGVAPGSPDSGSLSYATGTGGPSSFSNATPGSVAQTAITNAAGPGPTESSSGIPLAAAATDPTVLGSAGTSGGYGGNLGDASTTELGETLGPGVGGAASDPLQLINAAPGTAAAAGATGLLGSAGSWIANNPLMAAALGLGGGELLYNLLKPSTLPYQQQQEQTAAQAQQNATSLEAQGQQDISYQQTGTLPPGMQAQVNQAVQDAITASNSKYASMGLGNSTMAQQEASYIQLQGQALAGQLQQELATTGTTLISDATSDLSVSAGVYSSLMNAQVQENDQLEASVTQFAGSLALASVLGGKTQGTQTTAKAA